MHWLNAKFTITLLGWTASISDISRKNIAFVFWRQDVFHVLLVNEHNTNDFLLVKIVSEGFSVGNNLFLEIH